MRIQYDKTSNTLTVPLKGTTRTKAQQHLLRQLVKSGKLTDAVNYIETFTGKRSWLNQAKTRVEGIDRLSKKKKNSIKQLFDRMVDTDTNHTPFNEETTFIGVEIECFIPYENSYEDFGGEGRECEYCDGSGTQYHEDDEGNGHDEECGHCDGRGETGVSIRACYHQLSQIFKRERVKFTSIKGDGSINAKPGFFPVEICILTRLNKPDNLETVCKILNKLGAKVNKSCGMHVHLDARHLEVNEVKRVGKKFENALPLLLQCVPVTRRTNSYCRPRVSEIRGDRYSAVNLTAFYEHKTVEVRMHSSTTSFNKIIQWAKLISSVFNASKLNRPVSDLMQLTEFVKLEEETIEYFAQRIAMFSGEKSNATAVDQDEVA